MAITSEQRKRREKFIGSSDVPRIMMGQSFRVVLEKLGLATEDSRDEDDLEALAISDDAEPIEEEDDDRFIDANPAEEDSFEIQIGHKVESVILDAYERKYRPVRLERSPDTFMSKQYPWLGVHLDGLATYPTQVIDTEAKTVGFYRRKEWGEAEDDIPPRVMWQVQDQMLVTGLKLTHIPVCFIDAKSLKYLFLEKLPPIRVYVIQADEVLQAYIVKRTKEVADYIAAGMLPPPDTLDDLLYLYQRDSGKLIEATDEVAQACVDLAELRAQQAENESRQARLQFRIKEFMKDAAELFYDNKRLATWKKAADGERLDKAALERTHPKLFRKFQVPVQGSRRFLLKDKKIKEIQ